VWRTLILQKPHMLQPPPACLSSGCFREKCLTNGCHDGSGSLPSTAKAWRTSSETLSELSAYLVLQPGNEGS
jgi:hypothetical protein